MGNFPSLDEGAGIFYIGTHANHFSRRKRLKNEQEIVSEMREFSPFYAEYTVFLRISRNRVRLDSYSYSYYAQKIAYFALETIDFYWARCVCFSHA